MIFTGLTLGQPLEEFGHQFRIVAFAEELTISLRESLLGWSRTITHLDGLGHRVSK